MQGKETTSVLTVDVEDVKVSLGLSIWPSITVSLRKK
jgi:hypothetical protein